MAHKNNDDCGKNKKVGHKCFWALQNVLKFVIDVQFFVFPKNK